MGACFQTARFDGALSPAELQKQYKIYVDDLLYNHGADAYNGTLSTCGGLKVELHPAFDSHDAAFEYVEKKQEKWGPALAVKFKNVVKQKVKEPTFAGKKACPQDGQWHTMSDYSLNRAYYIEETQRLSKAFVLGPHPSIGGRVSEVVVADQLPQQVQKKLKTLVEDYLDSRRTLKAALEKWRDLHHELANIDKKLEVGFWPAIKKQRKTVETLSAKHKKLALTLSKFDEQHGEKLYEEQVTQGKEEWLVGGWCAE